MTVINDKRAVGIFSSHEETQITLSELKEASFPMNQVSIIVKDGDRLTESDQFGDVQVQDLNENQADNCIKTGATSGGVVDAVTGGLVGGILGLGIPQEQVQVYLDHVAGGSYLMIVDGTEEEIFQAEEILKHKGVRDWGVYNAPAPMNYLEPVVSL